MKILFHNFSINLFHPLGVICSRLKITLERYMTKLMTVDLDMFSNEKMLEEAKTNTCVYMSFHNLMQLAKAVKAYAKEIKENKKITNTFKILDIAELLNLNFDDIKRETVEKDFSEENVYFSCIFLDEHANNMLDIKLSTEIKSRKYKYEELVHPLYLLIPLESR